MRDHRTLIEGGLSLLLAFALGQGVTIRRSQSVRPFLSCFSESIQHTHASPIHPDADVAR